MGFSIKRLQVGLLAGAGVLILVIAGFLGYSRMLARQFLHNLPGKLGIDIKQETNGFTWSQSLQGKTIYTIHAAKAVQHSNGKWTLHDVGIVLYGRKQDRTDHIYGSQFEYDQTAGQIVATGEVQIDLAAPSSTEHGKSPAPMAAGSPNDHVIHIRTSGLSFEEKTHRAVTDQQIEFTSGGISGHAHGADYDSESGLIVLQTSVLLSGIMQDKPFVINASHAVMNQKDHLVLLDAAHFASVSDGRGNETLSANHAVVHTDEENNPERIEAEGTVTLAASARGTLVAEHADATIKNGRAEQAHLFGHLHYTDDQSTRQTTGEAQDARIAFDSLGRVSHIVVTGDVTGQEIVPDGIRDLHAAKLELAMAALGKDNTVLQDAVATGGARVHSLATATKSGARTRVNVSDLSGDVLTAHFNTAGGESVLSTLHGAGSTVLHQVDEHGVDQTSAGDVLDVSFAPKTGAKPVAGAPAPVEMQRASQHGNVSVVRTVPAKTGAATTTQRATAADAVYDAGTDHVVLSGAAQLSDPTGALWASKVDLDQDTGDAVAEGGVRTSYLQPVRAGAPAPEPVHILADRAVMHHDAGTAVFYGNMARLWQGGAQVEAPVLEFDQDKRTLFAHGTGTGDAAVVHAVLVPAAATPVKDAVKKPAKPGVPAVATGRRGPIRIASHEMLYSDEGRRIDLKGGVRVDDAGGTLHAREAVVYLVPAATPAAKPAKGSPAAVTIPTGGIDHMLATGGIRIEQPGRVATGEQLVYTAADQTSVLTGTKAAPPKVVDETQGTITGEAIRFRSGDSSVTVTGGDTPGRVHTETKVKQ